MEAETETETEDDVGGGGERKWAPGNVTRRERVRFGHVVQDGARRDR